MSEPLLDLSSLTATLVHEAGLSLSGAPPGGELLAEATAKLAQCHNKRVAIKDAAQLALPEPEVAAHKSFRNHPLLWHEGPLRSLFGRESLSTETDRLLLLRVPGGHLVHLARSPLVLTGSGDAVIGDFSSAYAPLIHHVDLDLDAALKNARSLTGRVFVLGNEEQSIDYTHWLLGTLPRLAPLRRLTRQDDVTVAVAPLRAAFQRESLHLSGFDDSRILELEPGQALRADELLVLNDLRAPSGLAFRASPWALRFLRDALGSGIIDVERGSLRGARIYLSSTGSAARKVGNENELVAELSSLGFAVIALAEKSSRERVAALANAQLIVAPNGVGLADVIFAPHTARILDLIPRSSGTPDCYRLAMGGRMKYTYMLTDEPMGADPTPLGDIRVNVARVGTRCRQMMNRTPASDCASDESPTTVEIFAYWDGYWDKGGAPIISAVQEWQKAFPDFYVCDDSDICRIIDKFFPQWSSLYARITLPSCKSDIARLVYLYYWGGFYIDAHAGPGSRDAVHELIARIAKFELIVFISDAALKEGKFVLHNGAMLGRKGSLILADLINTTFTNLLAYERAVAGGAPPTPYNLAAITGGWALGNRLFDLGNFPARLLQGGDKKPDLLLQGQFQGRVGVELADLDQVHPAFQWYRHYNYRRPGMHWTALQNKQPLLKASPALPQGA